VIEADIKTIKRHHLKTNKSLRDISAWQTRDEAWRIQHEKSDTKQFKEISAMLETLPTAEFIAKKIEDTIKITVNGKIDDVKLHLTKQDENLKALSDKIKPIDGARNWLAETGKIVLYLGALALAVGGILELLKFIGIIK
jgi:hypothetical protein